MLAYSSTPAALRILRHRNAGPADVTAGSSPRSRRPSYDVPRQPGLPVASWPGGPSPEIVRIPPRDLGVIGASPSTEG